MMMVFVMFSLSWFFYFLFIVYNIFIVDRTHHHHHQDDAFIKTCDKPHTLTQDSVSSAVQISTSSAHI